MKESTPSLNTTQCNLTNLCPVVSPDSCQAVTELLTAGLQTYLRGEGAGSLVFVVDTLAAQLPFGRNRAVAVKIRKNPSQSKQDIHNSQRFESGPRYSFFQEARRHCHCSPHPNILPVLAYGVDHNGVEQIFLPAAVPAMHLFRRVQQYDVPWVHGILAGVAHIMSSSPHKLCVFHLDLKPDNVLISSLTAGDPEPRAMITDFGAARECPDETLLLRRLHGTYRYLPPRVEPILAGQEPASELRWTRLDESFMAGLTCLELLFGQALVAMDAQHRIQRAPALQRLMEKDSSKLSHDLAGSEMRQALAQVLILLVTNEKDRLDVAEMAAEIESSLPKRPLQSLHSQSLQ